MNLPPKWTVSGHRLIVVFTLKFFSNEAFVWNVCVPVTRMNFKFKPWPVVAQWDHACALKEAGQPFIYGGRSGSSSLLGLPFMRAVVRHPLLCVQQPSRLFDRSRVSERQRRIKPRLGGFSPQGYPPCSWLDGRVRGKEDEGMKE